MRSEADMHDMLTALLATRKQMLLRKPPFDEASESVHETLIFTSNAEINLLAWVLGYGDHTNTFLELGVCAECAGRGYRWEELEETYVQTSCICQEPSAEAN